MQISSPRFFTSSALSLAVVVALVACGGGGSNAPSAPVASLPAAVAQRCIAPAMQAQTVALPAAGGVTGTISIGPVATASNACERVTLATGSDASLAVSATTAASVTRAEVRAAQERAQSESPVPAQPLAQVELTNAYSGNLTWASVTLQLPAGSVPAGQYPATITTTIVLGDGQISTSVKNFTVTVNASGQAIVTGPSVASALAVLGADTTGLLSIYPAGTVLPSPSPAPLESETPSPTPTTSAGTPAPTTPPTTKPTATPTPTATPLPTPSATADAQACNVSYTTPCGYAVFSGSYVGGANAGTSVSATPKPIYFTGLSPGTTIPIGEYFSGTITITLPNLYPGIEQMDDRAQFDFACPTSVAPQSGADGDTYTIAFDGSQFGVPPYPAGFSTAAFGCAIVIASPDGYPADQVGIYIYQGAAYGNSLRRR
jgi:hypothetical protein